MKYLSCLPLIFLANGLFLPDVGVAAEMRAPWRRWAIVASPEWQQDGLPDLLAVELSRRGGLELVERERLDLAAKELEVAACFGSAEAGKRLQLGRWLGADGLLLLSIEQREQKKYVKVVVSDCVYGARLRVEYLPYSATDAPQLAKRIASVVNAARQQFADGIRCLIAVSPFVSRDLDHDFDHWQNGFAALVEQALMTVPGVTVLELEEARSIGQELAVTGGEVRERLVPVFVDGEYATSRATPEAEPTVRLTIRVTQGDRRLETVSPGPVTEAEAVNVLAKRLPLELIDTAAAGKVVPLDRNQQFALLCQRAEAFSELGHWPQATGLREAALLLQPQQVDQRLRLIRDYRQWAPRRFRSTGKPNARDTQSGSTPPAPAGAGKQPTGHVEFLRHLARNIETVVAAGSLHPYDAAELLRVIRQHGWIETRDGLETPPELVEEQRRLFWSVAPRLRLLDASAPQRFNDFAVPCPRCYSWQGVVLGIVLEDLAIRIQFVVEGPRGERRPKKVWDDRDTLEDLYHLLTEVLPQDTLDPDVTRRMASNYDLVRFVREGRVTAEEANRFCGRLMDTNEPTHQFYARCGILALKAHRPEVSRLTPDEAQGADELLTYFARKVGTEFCEHDLEYTERDLQRLRDAARRKAGLAVDGSRTAPYEPIPPAESGRLITFRPVPGLTGSWTRMRPCGSEFDLMWAANVVYVMRERGVVKPIFFSLYSTDRISDVCWDGENVWVVSAKTGLRVLSPQGDVRAELRFGRELPPCNPGVQLHPVSPGRCLVLGRIGDEVRSWIALARQTPSAAGHQRPAFQATVLLTATKMSDSPEDSIDQAFVVRWLAECADPGQPGRRLLLIGRHERRNQHSTGRRPLAVDLDTLQISVFPTYLPASDVDHQEVYTVGGRFLWTSRLGTDVFSPGAGDPQRAHWDRQSLILPNLRRGDSPRSQFLIKDGKIYRPGYDWYRIDASQGRAERLNQERLPVRHVYYCYGVSVHYGLVAWNVGDTLHQVRFGGPVDLDEEMRNDFSYVPDSERAKHIAAVRRLRAAGGRVDAIYDDVSGAASSEGVAHRLDDGSVVSWVAPAVVRPRVGWSTVAFLPNEWRGDAETMDRLRDLWRLHVLWLIGANVDNQALTHLQGLNNLRSLALVDVPVDNDGLSVLADLHGLRDLQLGATRQDCRMGDEGLRHLTALPQLTQLNIVGHGFTDGALTHLKAMRSLTHLHIPSSMLTDRAVDELRGQGIDVMRFSW